MVNAFAKYRFMKASASHHFQIDPVISLGFMAVFEPDVIGLSHQPEFESGLTVGSKRDSEAIPRPSQGIGRVVSLPILGGLHHHYVRV